MVRRKLFKSIFEKLGPGLRLAVSGAAPLDPEVIRGFDRLGLIVYQGYGLTETSPVVAANNDFINVFGSIGHPVADVEVTIDNPDANGMGEILTRGENVMLGYYENDDATREVMEPDGWFHTGDLGTIEQNGVIRITGRAKSMIVLANGKKAFPEEFEMLLANITGVRDAFAWGYRTADGGVQICAKLVRDKDALKAAMTA
jgi:long-chain acyl-CoA synthetase